MAEEFAQDKPPLKVLALGHEGCGKTTLAAAVQHVMLLGNAPAAPKGKSLWSRLSSALSGDAPSPGLTPAPAAAAALIGPGMQARSIEWLDLPATQVADRITNLAPPPPQWTAQKVSAYRAQAVLIADSLGAASAFLAERLRQRIERYGR